MMKNIRVLDCTLRDGGRIFDCAFDDREISGMVSRLSDAKIDIIEVGFLRDWRKVEYDGNSTFFTDVNQIKSFINRTNDNTIYSAFIDYGMYDIESLGQYDGTSINAIRLGFTKKDYYESKEDVIRWANVIKERGYKLFIQGVNSLGYTDLELLQVIDMVNEIHPYSYGIVDTYGAMYIDDVQKLYSLINDNLLSDICINFHSHNNYQLSFAFAQEIIKLATNTSRNIIIDGTLSGMGKVAGNLCTELIVEFLVRKYHYDYDLDIVFDCIDDYIEKYREKYKWGYSISALMAGIYKSHPNNVIYLTDKFRLTSKDIGKMLSMIEPEKRTRYDYDNIQKLYIEYSSQNVDDTETISKMKEVSRGRNILVMVPGYSLNDYKDIINKYINNNTIVFSVNFDCEYESGWSFYGNIKRYEINHKGGNTLVSSNITPRDNDLVINYHNLINRGKKLFDNSTAMLMNFLKKLDFKDVYFAGFDGFSLDKSNNFIDKSFLDQRHSPKDYDSVNRELASIVCEFADAISGRSKVTFLTPTFLQKYIIRDDITFCINVNK